MSRTEIRAQIDAAIENLHRQDQNVDNAAAQAVLAQSAQAQAQIATAMILTDILEAVKHLAAQRYRTK